VGNTQHTVPYMLKHTSLFDELPEKFNDSAFLDRLHFYIPGWEVDIIRGEMFSSGYGFVVDYLAEILRSLRNHDFSDRYKALFTLSPDISTRDRDSINKTFSGLMKIIFPHGESQPDEVEELLKFAIEGRKRVKDQLHRLDSTYERVHFSYADASGQNKAVTTLEEEEYPAYYHKTILEENANSAPAQASLLTAQPPAPDPLPEPALKEKHLTFQENQKGITYDLLFGDYLNGATQITITDPYIRLFYQMRNFMEFLETLVKQKPVEAEISVHLITIEDEFKGEQQKENFEKIKESAQVIGINFSWDFDSSNTLHARHIVTDHGWKISLDRGLDIFQQYEMNDAFTFSNRLQQVRPCKAFEVTFISIQPTIS
jgi:ATP-dependent Lon protease